LTGHNVAADTGQMSQRTYELARQVRAEEIDAEETPTGAEIAFNPGTRFVIIHELYPWGVTRPEHCTIEVNGRIYNVHGRVLSASMREVE
jgi:hypothetical protein